MKQNDIIVLALAGVAVFMVLQATKAKTAAPARPGGTGTGSTSGTTEIYNAQGLPFDNGWRYYSDGTSIGPDGSYYFGGQKVWTP